MGLFKKLRRVFGLAADIASSGAVSRLTSIGFAIANAMGRQANGSKFQPLVVAIEESAQVFQAIEEVMSPASDGGTTITAEEATYLAQAANEARTAIENAWLALGVKKSGPAIKADDDGDDTVTV